MDKYIKLFSCVVFLLCGCAGLNETDPMAYRLIHNWETGDEDWYHFGGYNVLASKTINDGIMKVVLTPYEHGNVAPFPGYIEAAMDTGFEIMTKTCGAQNFKAYSSDLPGKTRIDRYFYKVDDYSLAVRFKCVGESNKIGSQEYLQTETSKWERANTSLEKVDNTLGRVDIIQTIQGQEFQMRVRIFGEDDGNLNRKLARKMMQKTCNSSYFEIREAKSSYDITKKGNQAQVISSSNVIQYTFTCF